MSEHRIAGEIILDHRAGEIYLDGERLPFHIDTDPEVEIGEHGHILYVRIGVLADRVTVISTAGEALTAESESYAAPDLHADDLAWARVEARRIVREGLSKWVTA